VKPGVFVGVLAVAAIAYISINSLRTEGPGSRGVAPGQELPAFAVPLALSRLDGDANVSGKACDVRGPDVLNSCQLAERGPVVLAFFAEPSDRCDDQIDVVDRLRSRFPDVQFAAVAIRGDRDELRRRVGDRGWTLPVGYDHDGAVANAYAVAICPTITLADREGKVTRTLLGVQSEQALVAAVKELK
jgi:AhpC/TSA family